MVCPSCANRNREGARFCDGCGAVEMGMRLVIERALALRLEAQGLASIDVAHNAVFRSHLRSHGGYEVKNQGDGFMLVFPDPTRAVECAAAIQRSLAEQELAESERVRVRMGLHSGEAIREEGDFFGRSVILAARIAAQAGGGEILVSESLKEMAGDSDLSFDRGRELELKGLSGTHEVFTAHWEEQPATPGSA